MGGIIMSELKLINDQDELVICIEEEAKQDIINCINMRDKAYSIKEEAEAKAKPLIEDANAILELALPLAGVKTSTLEGVGQVTYKKPSDPKPTCKVEDFMLELIKREVDPKIIDEAKKAATKEPEGKKEAKPSIAFTPWENIKKRGKGKKRG
jgi:hypothetical protein